ncbi:MAG: hypothetical protein LH473_02560 [Chitinophagales bacterium]|nr:hypothetical protein [Chitinophagales bacterium]
MKPGASSFSNTFLLWLMNALVMYVSSWMSVDESFAETINIVALLLVVNKMLLSRISVGRNIFFIGVR